MTPFSPEAERLLTAAGWYEGRQIDTSEYERAVVTAGCEICAPVCEFLRQFGDLEMETVIGDMDLNTLLAKIAPYPVWVSLVEELGRTFYSIGSDMFYSLSMDASGSVYRVMRITSQNSGGVDMYRIASSGVEALDLLLNDNGDVEGTYGATRTAVPGEWVAHWD